MPALPKNKKLSDKEFKSLLIQANSIFDRMRSKQWTQSFTTDDLYESLDYPNSVTYSDCLQKFKRQDIANRVVKSPVEGTWKTEPKIYETDLGETPFEKAWEELSVTLNIYYFFSKVDLLAALGRFSLLFLGFNDGVQPIIPAGKDTQIVYVTPIPESNVSINSWEKDIKSPRYGLPLTYQITIENDYIGATTTTVHWSRVIHIAENTVENEVFGIPFLEPVYNRLLGLDKLSGGSPEMYWRGARPGYAAQSTENAIISDTQLDQLKTQLTNFVNNMNRWIFTEGMTITPLAPQVVSPKEHVEVQLKLISAATRIPMRILIGSERGELASQQDERSWLGYLDERRETVGTDLIIRPFVDRLIGLGILPEPKTGEYFVEWDPLLVLSSKEAAEISLLKTDILTKYVNSPGASMLIPEHDFLEKFLSISEEDVERMLGVADETLENEDSLRDEEQNEESLKD